MTTATSHALPLLALRAAADEEAGWPWCPGDPAAEIASLSSSPSSSPDAWIALGEHFWHGHIRPHDRDPAAETLLGAAAGRAQFPTPRDHIHFLFGLARGLFTFPRRGGGDLVYNPGWYREVLRLSFSPALFARIRRNGPGGDITPEEAVFQHARAVFWAAVQVSMPREDRAFVHGNLVAAGAPSPLSYGSLHSLYWGVVLQAPVLMPPAVVGAALAAPFSHETLFYLRHCAPHSSTLATRLADYVAYATRSPPSIPEATDSGSGSGSIIETAGPIAILEAFAAAAGDPSGQRARRIWSLDRGTSSRGAALVARIIEAMGVPAGASSSSVYAVLVRASQLGILCTSSSSSEEEEEDEAKGWVAVLAAMLAGERILSFSVDEGDRRRRLLYGSKLLSLARHCGEAVAASSAGHPAASPSLSSYILLFPPCPAGEGVAADLWREAAREFCAAAASTPSGTPLKPAKRR